ncbi:MAG: glycoside hydrolase family 32 protein [Selenomonadaceae bacterium]|nr:glycoside hydrolase family 32 protein [Selenomonadaceae bacterium]
MKQSYHLEAPQGLINDPNGLCEFQGFYHIFFQWNPKAKDHSYKCWGHYISADMINWEFCGKAIEPGETFDKFGTYSGSACVVGEKLYIFYTGNNKIDGNRKSSQCLAISNDGKNFKKVGVILTTPQGYTEHFRDPKVNFDGKIFQMVIGAQQSNGKGAVVYTESQDGKNWGAVKKIASSKNFEMIECPDFVEIDGEKILFYGLQKRDNAADEVVSAESVYKFFTDSDLDFGAEKVDKGFDFYAPQTFQTSDGRKIMLAWMSRLSDAQERFLADDAPNIHCLTMPREIFLSNKKLFQKPAREMYKMLGEKISATCNIPRKFFCKIEKNLTGRNFSVELNDEIKICWTAEKIFKLRRKDITSGNFEERICALNELQEIEIWSDNSSVEIFLNGGEVAMSARTFPEENFFEIKLIGDLSAENLNVQKIF